VANGNGFDLKPVEDANFHAIAWNPDDLCPKCHEPIREEAKFCADCGVTLPRVLDAPPPAFSDTITFSVVDKPAKPEDAEKAIVLEEPATT
jgi:hypothetical protein